MRRRMTSMTTVPTSMSLLTQNLTTTCSLVPPIRPFAGAFARLREVVRARGGSGTTVAAGLYQGEQRMLAAYTRAGLVRTRVYWRMTVPTTR